MKLQTIAALVDLYILQYLIWTAIPILTTYVTQLHSVKEANSAN